LGIGIVAPAGLLRLALPLPLPLLLTLLWLFAVPLDLFESNISNASVMVESSKPSSNGSTIDMVVLPDEIGRTEEAVLEDDCTAAAAAAAVVVVVVEACVDELFALIKFLALVNGEC
jgi:hypothetical protein